MATSPTANRSKCEASSVRPCASGAFRARVTSRLPCALPCTGKAYMRAVEYTAVLTLSNVLPYAALTSDWV